MFSVATAMVVADHVVTWGCERSRITRLFAERFSNYASRFSRNGIDSRQGIFSVGRSVMCVPRDSAETVP